MNNLEEDQLAFMEGMRKLLGFEEYDEAEISRECEHSPDGFIYEDTAVYTTFRCRICGLHYDQHKI